MEQAETAAAAIEVGYEAYLRGFDGITARAADRFAARDWHGLQSDATERRDLYSGVVDETVQRVEEALGSRTGDRATWERARSAYAGLVAGRVDGELARTFFNSITRRVFHTQGVDASIEFLEPGSTSSSAPDVVRHEGDNVEDLLRLVIADAPLGGRWQNLSRDVRVAGEEVQRRLVPLGPERGVEVIEMLRAVFYRGQGAYLVGTIEADGRRLPLVLAIHHADRGLAVGAALVEVDDVSVLFSYTRAPFHASIDAPVSVVDYLGGLMPHKPRAELYTALGFHKHAKTELYRDFMAHVASTDERFGHARGIAGMVMLVFTMSGYDVVFKVIRDRFPYPKQTTRSQVMGKYELVFHHDRAGRLVDAYEFEHLRFERARFTPELLDDLVTNASRSVTVDGSAVTIHHAYVERRVIPLDVYLREANPVKARAAIVDYGRAIKNLAATNIFPGDMLLKNFGVTRAGRVVFYDYDELTPLTECKFRELPEATEPDDELSADPWFGVGEGDIFPEEFARFLGVRGELRETFDTYHRDLFGVRFWTRVQDRVRSGEVIEIFPYRRSRRLGAGVRGRTHREG